MFLNAGVVVVFHLYGSGIDDCVSKAKAKNKTNENRKKCVEICSVPSPVFLCVCDKWFHLNASVYQRDESLPLRQHEVGLNATLRLTAKNTPFLATYSNRFHF